ncbi:MAG: GtrA family protein [Spirochaetales bacterium]|nr:GtrA family protein [Spirochaetales bacterium]
MIKKIFQDKTHNTLIQFIRYAIAGGVASVFDYGSMLLFTEVIHVHYLISSGIGFCAGLIVNYILSVFWVFPVKMMKNRVLEFMVFGLIGFIGLGLVTLFLWFFTDLISIDYRISKFIAMGLVLLWNFIARKYLLFHTLKKKNNSDENNTAFKEEPK